LIIGLYLRALNMHAVSLEASDYISNSCLLSFIALFRRFITVLL